MPYLPRISALALTGAVLASGLATPAHAISKEYQKLSRDLAYRARIAISQGGYDTAKDLLQQAIVADPVNARAYMLYGRSHALDNDPDEAVRLYGLGLNIDPTLRQALQWRGEAYITLDKLEQARESLMHLQSLCTDCDERLALEAAIAQKDGAQ